MRALAARRIRYAANCMHGSGICEPLTEKQLASKRKTIKRLKREYKAKPYHLRDVPRECHAFVLDVQRGLATRRFPGLTDLPKPKTDTEDLNHETHFRKRPHFVPEHLRR